MKKIEFKGDFINAKWINSESPDFTWQKFSPSDSSDLVLDLTAKYSHVDQACEAAAKAFKSWSQLSLDDRKNYLLKLKDMYIEHKEEIAECISRETGKPLWETRGEAAALAGKIDITINSSLGHISEMKIDNALPGVTGYVKYKPRGVMAVLGPFNFPGHLPNGHYIPALLTGNTVVFKPSELTPATGQVLAMLFDKAEFPPGVFNLVQGPGETGARLAKHELVNTVLFTGSYETGLRIKQDTVNHYWKSCALEMGGKNTSIVWDDTDMDRAIYQNIFGAFASSGQRCSCTSRIIVHPSIHDEFVQRFHNTAKAIKIGHWSEDVFMGTLINEKSVDKFLRFQEIAKREGANNIMRGKLLELDKKGFYITPSINLIEESNPNSVYEKEEIFGPSVAIYKEGDLDKAIQLADSTNYGLSAAVFTKDRAVYQRVFDKLDVGLLNWNRATCGASSKLPFGGTKKSGNGHPSADFAVYYCTVPVAVLEDEGPFDKSELAIGVELK